MKIICTDNFDRENVSDTLVAENINEYYGEAMIGFLNDKYGGENSQDYFKLVDDDYKLYDHTVIY